MLINKKYILTYCSNIFKTKNLKKLILNIKNYIKEFKNTQRHISICLSKNLLNNFIKKKQKNLFFLKKNLIRSINGFVYQDFHKKNIKEKIYLPDWTSKYRLLYTKNIILSIKNINEIKNNISVSTMPLSYKEWTTEKQKPIIIYKSIKNIIKIISQTKNKNLINLAIEPEPYCILECYLDIINFYAIWIKKTAQKLKKHIRICYDICHFSVMFDKHEIALKSINKKQIKLGKIQISSALKIITPQKLHYAKPLILTLFKLRHSNFLHQCITKYKKNIKIYNDVNKIIKNLLNKKNIEIKIHCHIPLYKKKFKYFNTTHLETKKTIKYIKSQPLTKNLEIESYTYHFFFKKFCYTKSIKKEHVITIEE
ncbi:metabolite traffic protein EboE [Candidatus Azoamicus ciliaticola]|uniref:Xylose isomerase-like TIM barrel domain-containing protein n=1 Tax=Candidatus Azoamicus ciliaticola TaxID=2652803 RepID=A0A6J5JX97_9GAMM|nr:metabolite traffic protein EboE [Candidatus Azoamicus ciliaticola]CAB3976251.1 Uncharacterised protein [Candidatus Azoamicus ciliaticola]